ncbi:hypothetical protein NP493_286g00010 [Ridgeia piscesae]|uniref:Uncharacterized protein n=1 Tax=Ridgeia piscesae TaxID=27915 RepID=A0AAD9NWY4_RIDPI|nr:hypothetical protein NP493_286g00010 [Ridgeia piscesae]
MSLLPLKLPTVDTRLIKHDNKVYKLRLTYQSATSGQGDAQLHVSFCDASIREEIEKIIRVVLHRVTHGTTLCGVQTDHFLVDCVCQPWPAAKLLQFQQNHRQLQTHGDMLVLTLTAKGKESLAMAIGQRECVHAAASSRGRVVSADVCGHRGKSAAIGRVMNDNQQQKTLASTTQELPTIAASGRRGGKQRSTHIGTSPVRCSSKSQTKCSLATQPKKSSPNSTHTDSGSPSKQHALKGPRYQRHHQGDGDVDQVILRKTRSQQCQTKGGGLLQKDMEQCVTPDLCRHPLRSRHGHHRGSKALVQHEELREEMKLQQFFRPPAKSVLSSPDIDNRPESSLKRRVYDALDVIMTPVKKMFRSGNEVNEK